MGVILISSGLLPTQSVTPKCRAHQHPVSHQVLHDQVTIGLIARLYSLTWNLYSKRAFLDPINWLGLSSLMLGHSQQHVHQSVRVCKLVFLYERGGPSLLQSSPLFSAVYNQTEKKANQKKASPPPLLYLSRVAELVAPSSPIALRLPTSPLRVPGRRNVKEKRGAF